MVSTATPARCPECGAPWPPGVTCQDRFHQLLAWEFENPALFAFHHLTVLCYYLQHPSLYSPEGLAGAKQALVDFLVRGLSPAQVRAAERAGAESGRGKRKITGTTARHGVYREAVDWQMTVADVLLGGMDEYPENVYAWARSILEALEASGDLA